MHALHHRQRFGIITSMRTERRRNPRCVLIWFNRQLALGTKRVELLRGCSPIAIVHLKQQALKVGRHLNVHTWAECWHNRCHLHRMRIKESGENIVAV